LLTQQPQLPDLKAAQVADEDDEAALERAGAEEEFAAAEMVGEGAAKLSPKGNGAADKNAAQDGGTVKGNGATA
jgi:hypothetical protein